MFSKGSKMRRVNDADSASKSHHSPEAVLNSQGARSAIEAVEMSNMRSLDNGPARSYRSNQVNGNGNPLHYASP